MPQKIIIIRHGETDYNRERRIQGWIDVPLNAVGHAQAKQVAQLITKHKVDALYSSDLERAHQTARHIAAVVGVEVKLAPELRERDMGIFAGWAWEIEPDEVKEKLWVEFESARDSGVRAWKKHKGESIGDMADRIAKFVKVVHAQHANQNVAIVTHGGAINRILEHYGIKDVKEGYRTLTNASLTILTKKGGGYILEEL